MYFRRRGSDSHRKLKTAATTPPRDDDFFKKEEYLATSLDCRSIVPERSYTEGMGDSKQQQQQQQPPQEGPQVDNDDDDDVIAVVCDECRTRPAAYRCPRCRFRSCSLECCSAHKRRGAGCDGRRDRTAFLPVARMDDGTLRSDYFFLEDVVGRVDGGKRLFRQVGGGGGTNSGNGNGNGYHRHHKKPRRDSNNDGGEREEAEEHPPHALLQLKRPPEVAVSPVAAGFQSSSNDANPLVFPPTHPLHGHPKWRGFQKHAASKGITVVFMPNGMHRHTTNRSYVRRGKQVQKRKKYEKCDGGNDDDDNGGDNRTNNNSSDSVIHWTVEWRIHPPSTNSGVGDVARTCRQQVSERKALRDCISSVVAQSIGDSGAANIDSTYSLLIKRLPCPSNRPTYVELSRDATLEMALKDMTVIEYPTIEVVPPSRLPDFPRSIEVLATNVDDAEV